jgi:hypothetical protein
MIFFRQNLQGTGALLGNVFAFVLERKSDRQLLMGIYCLIGSIVNVCIPLYPNYYYVLAIFLLQGISKGAADFGEIILELNTYHSLGIYILS